MNLTTTQKMIVKTTNEIVKHDLAPAAKNIDCDHTYPRDGLKKLAEKEFLALTVPEPLGGAGGDTLSFALAAEGIAKGCPSTALCYVTHSIVARSIVVGGSDVLKKNLLPKMISGEKFGAFAVTEPNSGSNPMAVTTNAKFDGDDLVINGSKTFITGAKEADAYLVVFKTENAKSPMDLTAAIIEKDTPGFTFGNIESTMGLRGSSDGELFFEDCRVPKANIIGEENGYVKIMPAFVGLGLIGVAAMAVGIATVAAEAAVEHAKTRETGGQAIGQYQGVQFLISEMNTSVAAGRALTYDAAQQMDGPEPPSPFPIYMAKLFSTEMAIEVTHKALQVHGGTGYTQELPLERYYRDARGLTLHMMPSENLKGFMGMMLLGMAPF